MSSPSTDENSDAKGTSGVELGLTLTKSELSFLTKTEDELTSFNKRLMQVRKINLQNSFIEATNQRLAILKKIRKWIEMIEIRIFDPTTIAGLDIDKVIVLLKLAMRYTDRILTQIQCSEKAMKMYTEIDNIQVKMQQIQNTGVDHDARRELKEKMLKAVLGSLQDSITEVEVVETSKVAEMQEQEKKYEDELDKLEEEIKDKNLDIEEENITPEDIPDPEEQK